MADQTPSPLNFLSSVSTLSPARSRQDDRGERRAALMRAEQLLQQIGDNLRAVVGPERFATEAAPHSKTIQERIQRDLALLPPPN